MQYEWHKLCLTPVFKLIQIWFKAQYNNLFHNIQDWSLLYISRLAEVYFLLCIRYLWILKIYVLCIAYFIIEWLRSLLVKFLCQFICLVELLLKLLHLYRTYYHFIKKLFHFLVSYQRLWVDVGQCNLIHDLILFNEILPLADQIRTEFTYKQYWFFEVYFLSRVCYSPLSIEMSYLQRKDR